MEFSREVRLCIILLCLVFAFNHYARQGSLNYKNESGFRGLRWGAPVFKHEYAELLDFTEVSRSKYFCEYTKKDEKLSLGGVGLEKVVYHFLIDDGVEKFYEVKIYIRHGKHESQISQIVDALTKQYGGYRERGGKTDVVTIYIFTDDNNVSVSYMLNEASYYDIITISSKKMAREYRKAEKKASEDELRMFKDELRRLADF